MNFKKHYAARNGNGMRYENAGHCASAQPYYKVPLLRHFPLELQWFEGFYIL